MELEVIHNPHGFRLSGVECKADSLHAPFISFWANQVRIEKQFWFEPHMFNIFAATLKDAFKQLQGEAKLHLEHEPYPILSIKFFPNGKVHIVFQDECWGEVDQRLHIGFATDQTYLIPIIEKLKAV